MGRRMAHHAAMETTRAMVTVGPLPTNGAVHRGLHAAAPASGDDATRIATHPLAVPLARHTFASTQGGPASVHPRAGGERSSRNYMIQGVFQCPKAYRIGVS